MGKIVSLAKHRDAHAEQKISDADAAQFAKDLLADKLANDLVHMVMVELADIGADLSDSGYGVSMEAMNKIVLSMTRRFLDVFDSYNVLMDREENPVLVIGIGHKTDEED